MTELSGTWTLDPTHSSVNFIARHAMVTRIRGSFQDFNATLHINQDAPETSSVEALIQIASVNTGNADRDTHLRKNDFFEADRYPEASFVSTMFHVDEKGNGTVEGDMTIKGITKPIILIVATFGIQPDPMGNTRLGFEAATTFNRHAFGLDFDAPIETGGVLISNEIKVEIEGSAIRTGDSAAG